MENEVYDVIIIGAGIAGMTAAVYGRRANKKVLVLEEKIYGGQIINTFDIANWPGEERISGVELSQKIYHQMNKLGVDFENEKVMKIKEIQKSSTDKESERLFKVYGEDEAYLGRVIILAVGSIDKELGLSREKELTGRGVSYCATCDGAFYKEKAVAVVGGGNTALYDALYLSDIADKVYLIHRRDKFRGDAALVEKLREKKNVEFVLESYPIQFIGEDKIRGLRVTKITRDEAEGSTKEIELEVSGVFVAIGRTPATATFEGLVELDAKGYVSAGEDCRTSRPGVFVAGDCRTKELRQLVTAAADGAVAMSGAVKYLEDQRLTKILPGMA